MEKLKIVVRLFLAMLLLSCQFAVLAQGLQTRKKNVPKRNNSAVGLEIPIISVEAEVVSAISGSVVHDLINKDFTISENGVQQAIQVFETLRSPLSLLILVDGAGSKSDRQAVTDQIRVLKSTLARCLEPGDEMSVMAFGSRPVLLQDYTNDQELLREALDKASPNHSVSGPHLKTKFRTALEAAAKQAGNGRNSKARKIVVLFSAGSEGAGEEVLPVRSLRAVIGSGVIVCWSGTAWTGPAVVDEIEGPLDQMRIGAMVSLTGGQFVNDGDWPLFLERRRHGYRISYIPETDGRWEELVRIKLGLKRSTIEALGDVIITYPRFAIIPIYR